MSMLMCTNPHIEISGFKAKTQLSFGIETSLQSNSKLDSPKLGNPKQLVQCLGFRPTRIAQ